MLRLNYTCPMCQSFVHLHNHTEYSLLDGACRIPDMVQRAKEIGSPALAITDHGAMFGCVEFHDACKKEGIKPILGMEAYVSPKGRHEKNRDAYHLLLLARNKEGYRNLCKLHTIAALEGFHYRPRIDHEVLQEHAEGLISSTTCLGSEVNQYLLEGDYEKARDTAGFYRDLFGAENFFVELQDNRIPEQLSNNVQLVKIAKELGLPLVATNDAHFVCREDALVQDVLVCIGTGALLNEERKAPRMNADTYYLRDQAEMADLFPDYPEAIENSLLFAERCDFEIKKDRALMPQPDLPEGMDARAHLRQLAEKGLNDRIKNPDDEAWKRLNYELDVIATTGFDEYFLLVREFTGFSRSQGIATGVRGSAAGSLVSYTLGITDVDPLEYDLTFERFLNPERVSMPDIDLDFEDARRQEVIDFVTDRFGTDRVAQIVTFGTLGAKQAIKDVGRVMEKAPMELDRLCKTIPTGPGWSIAKARKELPDFRQILEREPEMAKVVETAERVEGMSRHCGVHAAGVVISNDPLDNHIPLYRGNEGQPITAYEMGDLETLGMLKMDFLGLSNLTVLARAIEAIERTHAELGAVERAQHPVLEGGVDAIPFDDQATYDLLARADTVGVFQLESGGMRRNIQELKPQSVKELAAMVALYRPGPMEHIPTFVDHKFGRKAPKYLDDRMEPILRETYGIIVYQDQVLKLVQALAGFTLGKADVLRRAMGKKKKAEMDRMHVDFVAGCEANGISRAVIDKVWKLLEPFAGYAFNKAHAVCYAILAYQTAYLKANYPAEYMAALLGVYRSKEDRVVAFVEECRKLGIPVLPPDVNASEIDFAIEVIDGKKAIRFGLGAIKNAGDGLVQQIIERRAEERYGHLFEFAERIRDAGLNRTSFESLVKAGALDSIDDNRKTLLDNVEGALVSADIRTRDRLAGQSSLFADDADEQQDQYPELPASEALGRSEKLAMEKAVLGVYVSDHPLRSYTRALDVVPSHSCASVEDLGENAKVKIAGVIANLRTRTTKGKGEQMAFVTLEDLTGQVSCTIFPKALERVGAFVKRDEVVVIHGRVAHRHRTGGEPEIEVVVDGMEELPVIEGGEEDESISGRLIVKLIAATRKQLAAFRDLVERNPGSYEVMVRLEADPEKPVVLLNRVDADGDFVDQVKRTFARCEVELRETGGFGAQAVGAERNEAVGSNVR